MMTTGAGKGNLHLPKTLQETITEEEKDKAALMNRWGITSFLSCAMFYELSVDKQNEQWLAAELIELNTAKCIPEFPYPSCKHSPSPPRKKTWKLSFWINREKAKLPALSKQHSLTHEQQIKHYYFIMTYIWEYNIYGNTYESYVICKQCS